MLSWRTLTEFRVFISEGLQDVARRGVVKPKECIDIYMIEGESTAQQRHILKGDGYTGTGKNSRESTSIQYCRSNTRLNGGGYSKSAIRNDREVFMEVS